MKYKLSFLSLLFPLLLLISGQAFAASCTSVAASAWATDTTWGTAGTGCSGAAVATGIPGAADDVTINTAVSLGANAAAKTVTINATNGTLAPAANTLTITPAATANAFVNNGTFTKGTSTIAFGAAATVAGSSATDFYNLSTSAGALTLPANATISNNLELSSTGTVALAATNTVGAGVTTYGTALTGTLKLTDAAHTITAASTAPTIPILDASAFTGGKIITGAGDFAITISSLIIPTGAANTVTLTTASSGSNTFVVTAAPSGGSCKNDGTAVSSYPTTVASTKSLVCTPSSSVPYVAPIFSTKEKAAVFTEEVKH